MHHQERADRADRVGRARTFRRIRLCIRRWKTPDNRRFRLVLLSARKNKTFRVAQCGYQAPANLYTLMPEPGAGGRVHRARPAAGSRRTERRGAPKAAPTRRQSRRGWATRMGDVPRRIRREATRLAAVIAEGVSANASGSWIEGSARVSRGGRREGSRLGMRGKSARAPADGWGAVRMFAVDVSAARKVGPVTTPASRRTSVAKRKRVSSEARRRGRRTRGEGRGTGGE
jgi:hypothetical protein